jgi:hypothetical protein
VLADELAGHVS